MISSPLQIERITCANNPETTGIVPSFDDGSTGLDEQPANNQITPYVSWTDNAYV